MDDHAFETRFADELRAYANRGVRPIDRYAVADEILGRARAPQVRAGFARRIALPGSRRFLVPVLVGLLMLGLGGGALLVGARVLQPAPTPTTYDAIFLRPVSAVPGAGLDIVAVAPDGSERLVRHLPTSILPDGRTFIGSATLSQDGWIALATTDVPGSDVTGSFAWALMDLRDPADRVRMARTSLGGDWAYGGLFAVGDPAVNRVGPVVVINAESGETVWRGVAGVGGGPYLIWAADGSGLVVRGARGSYGIRSMQDDSMGVITELAPRGGARWIGVGGKSLEICTKDPACADRAEAEPTLWERTGTGTLTRWYGGEHGLGTLGDASFTADGRAVWLLLDGGTDGERSAVLARADAPGQARAVVTIPDKGGDAWGSLRWLAPDDSVIALSLERGITLLRLSDLTTSTHDGHLAGFLPGSVTSQWSSAAEDQ